jgi:hypothetical protein
VRVLHQRIKACGFHPGQDFPSGSGPDGETRDGGAKPALQMGLSTVDPTITGVSPRA